MMPDGSELVVVYISQGPLGAEVARSKLQSEGIPALLRYASVGRVLGLTVDGLGRVEVLVPARFAPQARAALAEDAPPAESPSAAAAAASPDLT